MISEKYLEITCRTFITSHFLETLFNKRPAMHFEQTTDSDTVSIDQISLVQLVTNKKLEALNKA